MWEDVEFGRVVVPKRATYGIPTCAKDSTAFPSQHPRSCVVMRPRRFPNACRMKRPRDEAPPESVCIKFPGAGSC